VCSTSVAGNRPAGQDAVGLGGAVTELVGTDLVWCIGITVEGVKLAISLGHARTSST
jgi:hypothetical protein